MIVENNPLRIFSGIMLSNIVSSETLLLPSKNFVVCPLISPICSCSRLWKTLSTFVYFCLQDILIKRFYDFVLKYIWRWQPNNYFVVLGTAKLNVVPLAYITKHGLQLLYFKKENNVIKVPNVNISFLSDHLYKFLADMKYDCVFFCH